MIDYLNYKHSNEFHFLLICFKFKSVGKSKNGFLLSDIRILWNQNIKTNILDDFKFL